ncbi:MAG: PaaI family thioesterase [Hyphomicrobiaceae bacterium]
MHADYGLVPAETLKSMTGLELLDAIRRGELPAPPIMRTIDFDLVEVAAGRVVFEGRPALLHYNPIGTVHAGFAATLLDSAMGCAVHTTCEKGRGYTTLEFKINLVRAITDKTGPVRAEGQVVQSGRRVSTAEGRLLDGAGRLLAHASTTCLMLDL